MQVLLTGATGFIGANVARHLLARGDRVRCLIRKPNALIEGLDVECHTVPLEDTPEGVDALARVMEGCEGLLHVAGIFDPSPGGIERMRLVHVDGTRALLAAATKAGVRRAVVCSSSVTVGFGSKAAPGDEDSPLDPAALYGGPSGALRAYHDTKLASEELALNWPGLEGVVVNPDYILGAWDVKPTSGQLIVAMARRGMPFYPRGGKCFQDADDCAAGHLLALDKGVPGRRYLLGNENLSYQEFMEMVARVVGRSPPRLPLPLAASWAAGWVGRVGSRWDAHRFAGLDPYVLRSMQQPRYRTGRRATEELGVPATPIATAVEKAYRWFKDRGYLE